MRKIKRYHPLIMLFDISQLIKNAIFLVISLSMLKFASQSSYSIIGKALFFSIFAMSAISIIFKWFTHKYKIDDACFHIYNGFLSKTVQTIPFTKIQNINRHASLLHRIFNVTSISFETSMTGEGSSIKFEVISKSEADRMEALVRDQLITIKSQQGILSEVNVREKMNHQNRTIHFKPQKKDIIKASLTSLSFLACIPLLGSFFLKINEFLDLEKIITEIARGSIGAVILIIVFTILFSAIFGIVTTYLKYGNYKISSDDRYIHITKGIVEQTAYSISKEKVQAIEVKQTIMKRLLGLAEVKLTCVADLSSEENKHEIHSLYPYLPVQRAYEIVSEMLPSYEVSQKMSCLPKRFFWVRLIGQSWLWIIAIFLLYYNKISFYKIENLWVLSVILFIFFILLRIQGFFQTRFALNSHFIQFKKGYLTTSLFVSKREKIIEVSISQSFIQKRLGLASITTSNRSKPIHFAGVDDVPAEFASSVYHWYLKRQKEFN